MSTVSNVRLNPGHTDGNIANQTHDVRNQATDYFDIPVGQWSDTVDLTKIPKAIKLNSAGTYYIMAFGSDTVEIWEAAIPEIIPFPVKRIGESTSGGLDGNIKGLL